MIDYFYTFTTIYPAIIEFLMLMAIVIAIGLWIAIKENK